MGLYSSFDPSQYYDEPVVKKQQTQQAEASKPQKYKKPNQPIPEQKRRSLYDQAKEVATSISEYKGPDFKEVYRVGQKVAIKGPNGNFRTRNGRIAEIVAKNLMYVFMEDQYRDVNNQWIVDFVTDKDTVIPL